jgi:hypothetical protein
MNTNHTRLLFPQATRGSSVVPLLNYSTALRNGEAFGLEVPHFSDASLHVSQVVWNGALYSPKTRSGFRVVDLPTEFSERLRGFIGARKEGPAGGA